MRELALLGALQALALAPIALARRARRSPARLALIVTALVLLDAAAVATWLTSSELAVFPRQPAAGAVMLVGAAALSWQVRRTSVGVAALFALGTALWLPAAPVLVGAAALVAASSLAP